jgi:peroxiredoxin
MMRSLTLSVACVFAFGIALGGASDDEASTVKIGGAAPAWTRLPGVDGKTHSLADLKDKEIIVLIFTCNSCPVAEDYEERIVAFTKKYGGPRVAVVAVNVNLIPEDRLPRMKERAAEKGFNFPYLYDESQQLAKDYGALYTPEFFVLDKARKLAYMGAMDDKSNPKTAKENYLERAVEALLRGESPAPAETRARGCRIRYARKKS